MERVQVPTRELGLLIVVDGLATDEALAPTQVGALNAVGVLHGALENVRLLRCKQVEQPHAVHESDVLRGAVAHLRKLILMQILEAGIDDPGQRQQLLVELLLLEGHELLEHGWRNLPAQLDEAASNLGEVLCVATDHTSASGLATKALAPGRTHQSRAPALPVCQPDGDRWVDQAGAGH